MPEKRTIAVIAAHAEGRVLPETYDAAAFAEKLGNGAIEAVEIIVAGEGIDAVAEEIARQTGMDVRAVSCPGISAFSSEAWCALIAPMVSEKGFEFICAPHNSQGLDYAPALAAMLGAGCITGINGLFYEKETVYFQKDVYGGKVRANMASCAKTAVLTVQPGVFRLDAGGRRQPGRVTRVAVEGISGQVNVLGVRKAPADTSGLAEAKVVIAAGRGIGEAENMPLMDRLAALFPRSAVAGTRIVCDRGWLPYSRQVGVTGIAVAPALYFACGVSGASQHVMGMRGAGFVVAVNTDPQAAMFNESDVCIVEDINTFIPLLLGVFQQGQNENPVPAAPDNEESGG